MYLFNLRVLYGIHISLRAGDSHCELRHQSIKTFKYILHFHSTQNWAEQCPQVREMLLVSEVIESILQNKSEVTHLCRKQLIKIRCRVERLLLKASIDKPHTQKLSTMSM